MGILLYDGIVIAVLALFAWFGWRRGLLLSLCGLAVAVVAFLGAGLVADTLDTPLANALVPNLEALVGDRITQHFEDGDTVSIADMLRQEGGLYAWAADAVEKGALDEEHLFTDVTSAARTAAQAVAQRIAHTFLFAVAFLLLYVLLILALHALNLVAKLPGLHFCNSLGGGVIGLLKGGIFVFVAVGAATLLFSAYLPDAQAMERSYIFRFFVENNPITDLFAG